MGERIQGGNSFFHYPPSGLHAASPHRTNYLPSDRDRYLTELFGERQKLQPFMQVLPHCSRLLNQGYNSAFLDHDGLHHEGHYRLSNLLLNGRPLDIERRSVMQIEIGVADFCRNIRFLFVNQENGHLQKFAQFQASPIGWPGAMCVQSTPVVKKVIRFDVPVDRNPNYNFVGRILGSRGNSLKRVESLTQCSVYIRGKGSVEDSMKEEKFKDTPGYEDLNEPLHILVEPEFPEDMINLQIEKVVAILKNLVKPVDESSDHYKKQQLWELALLNGTLREESPSMSPSMSPFSNSGMKRAKMGFLDRRSLI